MACTFEALKDPRVRAAVVEGYVEDVIAAMERKERRRLRVERLRFEAHLAKAIAGEGAGL